MEYIGMIVSYMMSTTFGDIVTAVILGIASISIYRIAYSAGSFYLRLLWIVALVVAVRAWVLQ